MTTHETTIHYSQEVPLFEGFLDPYMKYSSGWFEPAEEPLDSAIVRMLDKIIDLSGIDARTDQINDQPFVLDSNSVHAAGEIMQVRSGNIITVSVLTNPAVTGAEMVFRVQVDATVTGLLGADSFIL